MTQPSVLVLLGSARSDGNTADTARDLIAALPSMAELVDLKALGLEPFDYDTNERPDAFLPLVRRLISASDIVFTTPVYWFAMSGVMKTFFDRLTNLLRPPNKPLGRALAGRRAWLLATGTDPALPPGFETPFRLTADHFGMDFAGACYRRYLRDHEPETAGALALKGLAEAMAGRLRS